MDRKIGIMVVVLVLSLMFADQVTVLFAQTPEGSTTKKVQSSNDTSTGKVSNSSQKDSETQTSSKIPTQKTQSSDDTLSGKVDPKTQLANEPTKKGAATDNSKNFSGIGTLLLGIAAVLVFLLQLAKFIYKVKSKVTLPYSAEDIDKRDIAEKLDKIQKAVEQNPKTSFIQKTIADAYMLQRGERIEEAIEKWRSIANIAEGNDNDLASKALTSVGYLCLKEGTGERALSALNKAINLKPDFDEAYNTRGVVKNFLGKHQDAIADYDKAIWLKSDYAEAYSNRGVAKNFLGKHQDAIADYDKAIRLKPDCAGTYDSRGSTKYFLGKYQDAIVDYDEAIRLKPDDPELYCHRGQANRTLEKYEAALVDYNRAIDLKPGDAKIYNNRGFVKLQLGQYKEAITDYSEAIRLINSGEAQLDSNRENSISLIFKDSGFSEAEVYYNRGAAKLELGEFAEAIADYNAAIQLKPDYAEAYHNRGVVKIQLNQPNEALADFDEAIRINPNYAEAYSNRGGAKLLLGKPNKAIVDCDEAIRINPEFINAYNNRAEAKISLRNIKEAKSDLQTALELAEQQQNTGLKASIAAKLQQLDNLTPKTDET